MKKATKHLLTTISYRFKKTIHETSEDFGQFEIGEGVRTPNEIIRHMTDVLQYADKLISLQKPGQLAPLSYPQTTARFFAHLNAFDKNLDKKTLSEKEYLQIIQGPLSDILTHVGQIALLRRLYGRPILKEDFMKARLGSSNE